MTDTLAGFWAAISEKMKLESPDTSAAVLDAMEGAFYAGAVATLKLQAMGHTEQTLTTEAMKMVESWAEGRND